MDSSSDEEDYLEAAERNAKRNFLKEEIIDMSYDPHLFTKFIENAKAADIDAWTFDELSEIVREFKNKYRAEQTLEDIEEQERIEKEKEKRLYEIPIKKNPQSLEEKQQKNDKKYKGKPKVVEPTPAPQAVKDNGREASKTIENMQKKLIDSSVNEIISEDKNKPKYYAETPILNAIRGAVFTSEPLQKAQKKDVEEERKIDYQPKPKNEAEGPLKASKPKIEKKPNEQVVSRLETPKYEEDYGYKRNDTPITQTDSDISEASIGGETYDLPAQLAKETELSRASNLSIKISSFEIIEAGFFGSNYLVYKVTTNPLGWDVKRRYSEFALLREVLANSYPGYYIPPLPQKKATGKTLEMNAIKRQKFLQRYMNSILANPMLKTCTFLVQFLKESNLSEWKNIKSQNKKVKKLEGLKTYPSLDGYLHCHTIDHTPVVSKINDHLSYSEAIKKKLKRHFENVVEDFYKISMSLADSANLLKELADVQSILNFNTDQQYVYDSLNEVFTQWSNYEKEQGHLISDYFYNFFRYGHMESGALKDLLRERENLMGVYRKIENKNKGTDKIRDLFGYHNALSVSECERVINQTKQTACEHFGDFAKTQKNHAGKSQLIWETLLGKMLETSERINKAR